MRLALADLLCQSCNGYVHPFFDRCPGCGARRVSWYGDVLNGADLGAADMAQDPVVTTAATDTIRRTMILVALHGALSRGRLVAEPNVADAVDAAQMIDFLGAGLTYRARGVPAEPATPIDARLRVLGDALVLSATQGGRTLASVPAATILGACPGGGRRRANASWDGTWIEGARIPTTPGVPPGELLMIHATDRGASSLSIANPSGLFANRPSPAHYEELARWIGLLAIVHSETRWQRIGVATYAAELGLTASGPDRGLSGRTDAALQGSPTTSAAREATSTAHDAMLELEQLRAADLITQQEYEDKRREVLRRL